MNQSTYQPINRFTKRIKIISVNRLFCYSVHWLFGSLVIRSDAGFGLVEIIVAMAIFIMIAATGATTIIQSFRINRLGLEETEANMYSQEGIEGVRSIKNRGWSSMDIGNTTCGATSNKGLTTGAGSWAFLGTSETLGKYTRTITVGNVCRNGSGVITEPGTIYDTDVKKITSTTNWAFTTGRNNTVALVSYLSNFTKPIGLSGGILVYGDTTAPPKYQTYDAGANSFGSETPTVGGAAALNIVVKSSPTKQEAVAGYVTSGGMLQIMCFDGLTWTDEWNVSVGGTGTTRRFDVTYEYQSGDVMVLYSTNAGTNELDYRTKSGSTGCGSANWVDQTAFDSPGTTGVATWIKLTADSRTGSNVLAASWADMNRDLQAAIWNGSAWTQRTTALETTLECRGTCTSSPTIPNGDSFDIDFESSSGHIMVVWGSGGSGTANGAWYNKCDGTAPPSCTWNLSRTAITSMSNDATSLDISANPNTDDILFGSIGDGGSDLQAARWSGTAWTGTNDLDTSALTPVAGSSFVATGWLINGATSRGIVIFTNSGTQAQRIHGFAWNGSSFVRQGTDTTPWFTPTPLFGTVRWYDIQTDPTDKSRLMFLTSDTNNDLFAKRLEMNSLGVFTWTNPTYASGSAIETGLSQSTTSPYYFSYWRNP